ncbi:plant UBX domain-containing protein 10-like [Cornus florida]|uniref:plant UBX domain-containing protein 10-like n=1 Tax=Cornus florida TaxID=4283 RepID=UPI002899AAC1|nr:plant UBX domain-containing protein 10-like [Cornus florida]
MSSMTRGRARATGEASYNGIVRRMVSIPQNIIRGFSRAMGHGIDLMGIGGRRSQYLPSIFPFQHPQEPVIVQEERAFLASFEQQYGTMHPCFYECRFMEALKIAQDEQKFMFMYLHSPEHPFTPPFCKETLCSELVVQFIDANFVCWAALANRGEGLQMAMTLQPASFPFCAVVAPASGDNMAILQQMEGPVSPAELLEILQRTMEEQGLVFGSSRVKEEEKRRSDRRLREEQDAAYVAALQIDKEKERLKNLHSEEERAQRQVQASNKANYEKLKQNPTRNQTSKVKETLSTRETQATDVAGRGKDAAQVTQILIRFPNGERREQSFLCTDKIQAVFRYIDSLGLPGVGNYRLISSFPRKVYGADQMGMTLKDAGLHPKASLFLEIL